MKEKVLRLVQKYKKNFGGESPTSVYNKIVTDSEFYGTPLSKILDSENYVIFIFLVSSSEDDLSKLYDMLKLKMFHSEILEVVDDDPETECDSCYGSGKVECYSCDGNGEIDCDTCYGEGEDEQGESCGECQGGGKTECDDCGSSGNVECDKCDGDGYVRHGDFYEVITYNVISYDEKLFNELTYVPQYSTLEDTVIHEIMDNKKCLISTSNDERSDLVDEEVSTGDYVFDEITDLGEVSFYLNSSGKIL
jgi:hypothetical protein